MTTKNQPDLDNNYEAPPSQRVRGIYRGRWRTTDAARWMLVGYKMPMRGGGLHLVGMEQVCLPYGKWICADGREVLFNRLYQPIWQRYPGQPAEAADLFEWVGDIVHQEWFYDDATTPGRSLKTYARCDGVLESWGIPVGDCQRPLSIATPIWRGPRGQLIDGTGSTELPH